MSDSQTVVRVRGLRVVLVTLAFLCYLQFALALLPTVVVRSVAALFGGLAREANLIMDAPLFWYSLRESAVLYLALALVLTVVARDPTRYLSILKVAIFVLFASACMAAVAGVASRMPLLWYAADSLVSLVFFALLALFYPRHLEGLG